MLTMVTTEMNWLAWRRRGAASRLSQVTGRRLSVRLPAQERRDVELILFAQGYAQGLPAVLVEPLRRRALGVFGDRSPGALARSDGRGMGRPVSRSGVAGATGHRAAAAPVLVLVLLAAAEADRGQALQQDYAALSGCSSCGSSPRRARISFCAGTGSSSMRGIRGARVGGRSACGGMNAAGSSARSMRPARSRPDR